VRNGNELVAGQRRLEACRRLGWKRIPVRQVDRLSDDELRAIEFDENREREALNTYDDSKQRLAAIRQAEADLKAKAQEQELRSPAERNSTNPNKRGRKKKAGSRRAVADATGIALSTQVEVQQHVELADRYPFMQREGWVQHHVLEAGTHLDKIPDRDRGACAALLDQDAIPPKKAI